ncbi:hypothetical protein [Streptomyces incarnatus]|uniref:hypothetical protein n=1 Tax=Streptomyces incarnatus TaxID=665007 RepID=UPI000ADC58B8|nr:hypothetical protein [Streptomyces incarnatus]
MLIEPKVITLDRAALAGVVTGAADADAGGSMLLGVRVVGLGVSTARAMEEGATGSAASSAADEAADDDAGVVAAKRATAQEHATEANAEAAKPSRPGVGNPDITKPCSAGLVCSPCGVSRHMGVQGRG